MKFLVTLLLLPWSALAFFQTPTQPLTLYQSGYLPNGGQIIVGNTDTGTGDFAAQPVAADFFLKNCLQYQLVNDSNTLVLSSGIDCVMTGSGSDFTCNDGTSFYYGYAIHGNILYDTHAFEVCEWTNLIGSWPCCNVAYGTLTNVVCTAPFFAPTIFGSSDGSYGVYGSSTAAAGVYGNSSAAQGVFGYSSANVGVYGQSSAAAGVYGSSTAAQGVFGNSYADVGVYGQSSAAQGISGYSSVDVGVYGNSDGSYGVYGNSSVDVGVYGNSFGSYGVYGYSDGSYGVYGNSSFDAGVYGYSTAASGVHGYSTADVGVYGVSTVDAGVSGYSAVFVGVYGNAAAPDQYGVYGTSAGGHGVWSDGDLQVTTSASFMSDNCGVDATNGRIFQKTPNGTKVYLHLTDPVAGVSTATWTTTP